MFKKVGKLESTDLIMNNTFWIGVYPGMKKEMLVYVAKVFADFINGR